MTIIILLPSNCAFIPDLTCVDYHHRCSYVFYLPYNIALKAHRYSSLMELSPLLVGMLEVQILPLLSNLFAYDKEDRDIKLGYDGRDGAYKIKRLIIVCVVGVSVMGLMYQPRQLSMWMDAMRLVFLSVVRYSMLIFCIRASNRSFTTTISDDLGSAATTITTISGDHEVTSSSKWSYPLISLYGHVTCILCHLLKRV